MCHVARAGEIAGQSFQREAFCDSSSAVSGWRRTTSKALQWDWLESFAARPLVTVLTRGRVPSISVSAEAIAASARSGLCRSQRGVCSSERGRVQRSVHPLPRRLTPGHARGQYSVESGTLGGRGADGADAHGVRERSQRRGRWRWRGSSGDARVCVRGFHRARHSSSRPIQRVRPGGRNNGSHRRCTHGTDTRRGWSWGRDGGRQSPGWDAHHGRAAGEPGRLEHASPPRDAGARWGQF